MSIVVIVFSLIMAVFLGAVDYGLIILVRQVITKGQ